MLLSAWKVTKDAGGLLYATGMSLGCSCGWLDANPPDPA